MTRELPAALYRPDQVAELDRRAIEDFNTPGFELMRRAGAVAYRALRAAWPGRCHLCVLCGGGNNGGDGYIIAELARRDGLSVDLLYLLDPARLQGSAAQAAQRYQDAGGHPQAFDGELPDECDVIVDAMLGTGLQREVAGRYRQAVEAVNASLLPVLAVDIPSGLDGATGGVLGAAVRADVTTTFIGLKAGLVTGEGPARTGRLVFADLDVPPGVYDDLPPMAWRRDYDSLYHWFPARARDTHKGHCGHVLVVGGDHGTAGAALMAGSAAARSGAGLVSVATRGEHAPGFLAARPELMVHDAQALEALLPRADVLVTGPGLGRGDWGEGLLERVLQFPGPLVLDADALNALAERPRRRDHWVLTPHPGEAGRLLGLAAGEVQADRFRALEGLIETYGGTAVLKGVGTLVGSHGTTPAVCGVGNPGMASGGMGDVLSGVLGGLIAQGLDPDGAARVGVWLHGAAADRAAAEGERGLLATDLLAPLRALANPD